jgi:riboflavin-specific deaminase-like protein
MKTIPNRSRRREAELSVEVSASSRRRLPFVLMNMSMTADGKIATANRAVSSFGSRRDHAHLLELRATADAVMCGARTADLNEITLGPGGAKFRRARLKRGLAEFNLRVIVSGSGSINPRARIFSLSPSDGERAGVRGRRVIDRTKSPIIILTTAKAGTRKLKQLRAVADEVKVFGKTGLNLRAALAWLRRQWNVKRLVCEGGGELNDAMFRAGLVDELHITLCPRIIGGRNAPTIADGTGFQKLARAAQLQLESARRVGDELFLVYRKCKSRS